MDTNKTKSWFDCLDAVACEMEADRSFTVKDNLINVMDSAGITLKEVRWAQEQGYVTLDRSEILITYEGILMEREEKQEYIN